MSLRLTPNQTRVLETPPIFTPDHLAWFRAKQAIALQDFERADPKDTEEVLRTGLVYREWAKMGDQLERIIEDQQGGR